MERKETGMGRKGRERGGGDKRRGMEWKGKKEEVDRTEKEREKKL